MNNNHMITRLGNINNIKFHIIKETKRKSFSKLITLKNLQSKYLLIRFFIFLDQISIY